MSKSSGKGSSGSSKSSNTGARTGGGGRDSGAELTGFPGGNWPSKTGGISGNNRGNAPQGNKGR